MLEQSMGAKNQGPTVYIVWRNRFLGSLKKKKKYQHSVFLLSFYMALRPTHPATHSYNGHHPPYSFSLYPLCEEEKGAAY